MSQLPPVACSRTGRLSSTPGDAQVCAWLRGPGLRPGCPAPGCCIRLPARSACGGAQPHDGSAATTQETGPAVPGEGPALLAIDFDHRLKSGTLKLWLDEELALEEKLEGRVSKKILSFKLRKGSVDQLFEVVPGRHKLKVNVSWDDNSKNAWISGNFLAGEKRTLEVSQNLITRDLSLDWR